LFIGVLAYYGQLAAGSLFDGSVVVVNRHCDHDPPWCMHAISKKKIAKQAKLQSNPVRRLPAIGQVATAEFSTNLSRHFSNWHPYA